MNIWVPLANLTYSIYLFHLVMFVCSEIAKGIVSNATGKTVPDSAPEETAEEISEEEIDPTTMECIFNPTEEAYMFWICFFLTLILSILIATFIFVFIEK